MEDLVIRAGETFKGPCGGEYSRLADAPGIVTVTCWDGRIIRMYLADIQAFAVACADDPDEWYAAEVERMRERAPA